MKKFISIIIPAYNEDKNIRKCINSLLLQTYPKDFYEIIVIDNNSTDNTWHIINKLPVKALQENKKQGPASARNRGIVAAKGDIVAFIDADCIADPDWLANGVKHFKDNTVGCVGGRSLVYKPSSLLEKVLEDSGAVGAQRGPILTYPFPYFPTLNVFFRKEVFDEIGYFDESLITGEDVDLCWRMQFYSNYKMAFAQDAVVYHKCRGSLWGLFKQRKGYAVGRVLLFKKYKNMLPKRSLKEIYWSYYGLFSACKRFLISGSISFIRNKPKEFWYKSYIEMVIALARKLGHWEGSIRYKWFHI